MPAIFPTAAKISPSFTEPDIVVTYAQASGAMALLAGGKPRVKIGPEDMAVYVNRLDLRSDALGGQSPSNMLPSASLVINYDNTPTYRIASRAQWDHHDTARAALWDVNLVSAYDLAAFQGIFQQMRTAELYGFNPGNGEGLLNTPNATVVTLPPDSFGNASVRTYDNGQMALFLLNQIVALKSGMWQSGGNIKNEVVICGPQRELLLWQMAGLVQVTSSQRPGAGTSTFAEVVRGTLGDNGDTFEWHFDDTLIGQASGGNDAVLLTIPEIEVPDLPGSFNTNAFGDMKPSMKAVNLMYMDQAAPMKIPTPIPDGGITQIYELRITSGWNIRPQGLYILSMPY